MNLNTIDPNKLLATLARIGSIGIYQTNAQGVCIYINDCGCKITGLAPESALGEGWMQTIHPDDREKVFQAWNVASQSQQDFNMEYRFLRPNGETCWVLGQVVAEQDATNSLVGYIGILTDITARKRFELDLQENEATFRKLFEESSDAINLIDDTGVFVECNQAALDLLKMKREQFLLQPPARISPEFQPDGQRSAEAAPKMIALAYRNGLHRFDWTCVNAEGGEFIVEVSLMPIVIKGRTLLHTTWRDVTKRKQIEDALRISEQRFRDVSEAAGEYLWEIDANMVYTYVSNRSIDVKGYSPEELLGHTPMEFMPEEDVGPVGEIINRAIANKAPFKLQHRDITKSGAVLWEEVNGIPFYDADGTVIGLRGAGMNITERKMSEQALTEAMHKLEEKELSKSRFFAAAGHDLRQPLTAANLFLDAIKRTKPTPKQDKIIERLDHTMSIFKGQLNSLLDIARLDSGTIKPEYEPINVTEFFNLLESTFTTISSDKQVGLRLHYPMKETLIVLGDIGLLNSVLMNLVSNAIKFTSKGGAILISARKRRYEVLFQVWDTGMGILEEHLEQIFDEFYQINNPQRDRSEGLGLGLSIAKRAITLIDSKITCHSKIGRGSVFEFRLPLDGVLRGKKQEAAIEALQEDEASLPFVQGKRFVAVEDDLLVAQALTQALEGLGGEVECFHSAEDALRHSNIGYADCYIIDYRLGGTLNGIQFLNTLRQKLDKPINAVLVTGDTSPTFIREAANFVWPVLHKPVNTAKLISTLSVQERKHV